MGRVLLDTSAVFSSPLWHSHPLHNLPLLGIRYPRRIQPIGELIGGPCRVMPNKCRSEVLRNPCALTLCDEPLASAVEHSPMQLRVEAAQVGIPLHHFIDSEIWEQPTSLWQRGIQQLLKYPMKGHLSLSCLGLQQADPVWPDANKPPQVALCCDVLCHEPTDLSRAHACEEPEEQGTVQHPFLGCQQDADLVIRQHTMGMNLWPVFDLEGLPGVGSQLPLTNTPVKELGHLLEDASLGLGCQRLPSSAIYLIKLSTRPIIDMALITKIPANISRFCSNFSTINLYDCYC
jgi:hypothetical protein